MKRGYKVIDMDTHIGPSFDVLCEYVDPSFRPRLPEMDQYRQRGGKNIAVAPYQWSRYAGHKPHERPEITAGGETGWSRNSRSDRGWHRAPPRPGVDEKDSQARLLDMDREGRDVDLIFPGNWAPPLVTLDWISSTDSTAPITGTSGSTAAPTQIDSRVWPCFPPPTSSGPWWS